jgi:hypothetical protein
VAEGWTWNGGERRAGLKEVTMELERGEDRNRREQIGERRIGEKEDRHGNRNDF